MIKIVVVTLAAFGISGCAEHVAPVAGAGDGGIASISVSNPEPGIAPTTQSTSAGNDRVIAMANGEPITLAQIEKPLIEAYGLNVLLNVVQLNLVKQQAQATHVTSSQADIDKERELTMGQMFIGASKEDYAALLIQFLEKEKISRPEFDVVMETNAYLRKLAEPRLAGRITEENVKEGFATLYGATIQSRHIQVSNLQEVAEAKRKLASGEPFDQVAREMSRDATTAPLGGELPAFGMETPGLAQSFKETAFALKEGEVSDPVEANGAYHLIKLEKKIPPKDVKFEDVKEKVRTELYDRWTQATIRDLRQQLAKSAVQTLEIRDPVLKKQFDDRMGKGQAAVKSQQEIQRKMAEDRERIRKSQEFHEGAATGPTTGPVTKTSVPATKPSP